RCLTPRGAGVPGPGAAPGSPDRALRHSRGGLVASSVGRVGSSRGGLGSPRFEAPSSGGGGPFGRSSSLDILHHLEMRTGSGARWELGHPILTYLIYETGAGYCKGELHGPTADALRHLESKSSHLP